MFPQARTSTLAQRALDALRLTRSFLLLEDGHDVDWEVDQSEHSQAIHPHRAPLRGRRGPRRPGQPARVTHLCLCPLPGAAHGHDGGARERTTQPSAGRRAPHTGPRRMQGGQQRL
jgi:hypothetical protein